MDLRLPTTARITKTVLDHPTKDDDIEYEQQYIRLASRYSLDVTDITNLECDIHGNLLCTGIQHHCAESGAVRFELALPFTLKERILSILSYTYQKSAYERKLKAFFTGVSEVLGKIGFAVVYWGQRYRIRFDRRDLRLSAKTNFLSQYFDLPLEPVRKDTVRIMIPCYYLVGDR